MSIYSRLKRIAKANIDELLNQFDAGEEERFEDKVQELEDAFQEAKAAAANYSITFRQMEEERNEVVRDLEKLDDEALEALKGGDDDAARSSLGKKMGLEERLYTLTPALDENRKTYDELKQKLRELKHKLAQARARQAELEARLQAAEAQRSVDDVLSGIHEQNEALKKEQGEALDQEIEREVKRQTDDVHKRDYEDVEKNARELQIDARLEELRKRMGPDA